MCLFFFQAEDGIRDLVRSRGLGDVYKRQVEVMAHETGHNFGSNHTQACVWPSLPGGNIGAIDSCVDAEQGSCFSQTRPNPNGTITVSYTHLTLPTSDLV